VKTSEHGKKEDFFYIYKIHSFYIHKRSVVRRQLAVDNEEHRLRSKWGREGVFFYKIKSLLNVLNHLFEA
jgi:hypothetical protein